MAARHSWRACAYSGAAAGQPLDPAACRLFGERRGVCTSISGRSPAAQQQRGPAAAQQQRGPAAVQPSSPAAAAAAHLRLPLQRAHARAQLRELGVCQPRLRALLHQRLQRRDLRAAKGRRSPRVSRRGRAAAGRGCRACRELTAAGAAGAHLLRRGRLRQHAARGGLPGGAGGDQLLQLLHALQRKAHLGRLRQQLPHQHRLGAVPGGQLGQQVRHLRVGRGRAGAVGARVRPRLGTAGRPGWAGGGELMGPGASEKSTNVSNQGGGRRGRLIVCNKFLCRHRRLPPSLQRCRAAAGRTCVSQRRQLLSSALVWPWRSVRTPSLEPWSAICGSRRRQQGARDQRAGHAHHQAPPRAAEHKLQRTSRGCRGKQ